VQGFFSEVAPLAYGDVSEIKFAAKARAIDKRGKSLNPPVAEMDPQVRIELLCRRCYFGRGEAEAGGIVDRIERLDAEQPFDLHRQLADMNDGQDFIRGVRYGDLVRARIEQIAAP